MLTAVAVAGLAIGGCGSSASKPLPASWERGMNVTAYQPNAFALPIADKALSDLRDTGTNSVALVTQWYMDHAASTVVAPDPAKTPSDQSLLHAMATARMLGMRVVLKPHVDVRDGTFRGDIQPLSVDRWFTGYRAMIGHYAQVAAQGGASTLVVGVELTSMAQHPDLFRRVIADARARFPGRLTFAANWSTGAAQIRFWDALDEIGIDAYMPLRTSTLDPSVSALEAAWRPYVRDIAALHRRYGKPVVFTELGYQPRTGAALSPQAATGDASPRAQARAYEAAYRVWRHTPWFRGIYWWDWPADGRRAGPTEFTAAGAPAADVVRRFDGVKPRGGQR